MALFEGLIFGGAYLRREICVSKSIGLACSGKEIYHFCFVLLCIRGQIPSTSPPGGLYSEGRFNGGLFALRFWGAYTRRGLFSEFYGIYLPCGTKFLRGSNFCDFCDFSSIAISKNKFPQVKITANIFTAKIYSRVNIL